MKTEAPLIQASRRIREYLLVIDPPETLRHRVEKCREALVQAYGIHGAAMGRPHLSLARFRAPEMAEEKIIHRLQWISMAEKPFVVELRDFGSYPMHAIFIRIANQPRILQFISRLKEARKLMKLAGEDPWFIQDPNIALAGRLPRETYLDAMKEYLHKSFSGRFWADSCLLLKRRAGEKRYQIVRRFEFECLPAPAAQGSLFNL